MNRWRLQNENRTNILGTPPRTLFPVALPPQSNPILRTSGDISLLRTHTTDRILVRKRVLLSAKKLPILKRNIKNNRGPIAASAYR